MANENLTFTIVVDAKSGTASLKQVEEGARAAGKAGKEAGEQIQQGFNNAFTRISVLKEAFNAVKDSVLNLLSGYIKYEQATLRLGNISGEFADNIGNIQQQLKAMQLRVPVSDANELAEAMMRAGGMGNNLADSLKLTELAAKGAIAGFSTTQESMLALTTVMGAFGMKTSEANTVMDQLVMLSSRTGTTLGDLSGIFGRLAPMAEAANIPFTDLASVLSTLAKSGIPIETAASRLAMSLPQMAKAVENNLGRDTLATKGLIQSLYELGQNKAGAGFVELSKTAGRFGTIIVESITNNYTKAIAEQNAFRNSAGTLEDAFGRQKDSLALQIKSITDTFYQLKNNAVKTLVPIISTVGGFIKDLLDKWMQAPPIFKGLFSVIMVLIPALLALKLTGLAPLILSMGSFLANALSVIPGLGGLTTAMTETAFGAKALSFGMAGLATLGIGALLYFLPDVIKGIGDLSKSFSEKFDWNKFHGDLQESSDKLKNMTENVIPLISEYEELAKKTNKTQEEKTRLNEIVKELVNKYPELSTQVNFVTGEFIQGAIKGGVYVQIMKDLNDERAKITSESASVIAALRKESDELDRLLEVKNNKLFGFALRAIGLSGGITQSDLDAQKNIFSKKNTEIQKAVKVVVDGFEISRLQIKEKRELTKDELSGFVSDVQKDLRLTTDEMVANIPLINQLVNARRVSLMLTEDESKGKNKTKTPAKPAKEKASDPAKEKEKAFEQSLDAEINYWKDLYKADEIGSDVYLAGLQTINKKLRDNDIFTTLLSKQRSGKDLSELEKSQLVPLLRINNSIKDAIDDINKEKLKKIEQQSKAEATASKIATALLKEGIANELTALDEQCKELQKKYDDIIKNSFDFWYNLKKQFTDAEKLAELAGQIFSSIGDSFKEGINFENYLKGLKEGFKSILITIINYVEKIYAPAQIKALIESALDFGASLLKVAALLVVGSSLEVLKAGISKMATGGFVNKPTLAMVGEAGGEYIVPQKNYEQVQMKTVDKILKNLSVNSYQKQNITIRIEGELKGKGRDLFAIVSKEQLIDNLRFG